MAALWSYIKAFRILASSPSSTATAKGACTREGCASGDRIAQLWGRSWTAEVADASSIHPMQTNDVLKVEDKQYYSKTILHHSPVRRKSSFKVSRCIVTSRDPGTRCRKRTRLTS